MNRTIIAVAIAIIVFAAIACGLQSPIKSNSANADTADDDSASQSGCCVNSYDANYGMTLLRDYHTKAECAKAQVNQDSVLMWIADCSFFTVHSSQPTD